MQGQQMFLVVYREYLEDLVRDRLVRCGVESFSEFPRLWGHGTAGPAEDSWVWPGHNCALFTVLPEEQLQRLVAGFRDLVAEEQARRTEEVALRAFVLPCEVVI